MTFRKFAVAEPERADPVSRRDFLTMRVREGRRVLELSCERLFMRYHDACSDAAQRQVSNHEDVSGMPDVPMGFAMPSVEALFDELERQLAGVDELRVLERGWLGSGEFAREVAARIDAFTERGGVVGSEAAA